MDPQGMLNASAGGCATTARSGIQTLSPPGLIRSSFYMSYSLNSVQVTI